MDRKNREYELLKSKFDMINQNMRQKLTKNQKTYDEFRSGIQNDINQSLTYLSKKRASEIRVNTTEEKPGDRNFLNEFRNIMGKKSGINRNGVITNQSRINSAR